MFNKLSSIFLNYLSYIMNIWPKFTDFILGFYSFCDRLEIIESSGKNSYIT
jgi:hypothetical protein